MRFNGGRTEVPVTPYVFSIPILNAGGLPLKQASPHSLGFRKILETMAHDHDSRQVFDAFVRMTACALAAGSREEEYLTEAKQWSKSALDLFAQALGGLISEMDEHPFEDLLGPFYLEFALSKNSQDRNGEFHTPKPVADFMARILVGGGNSFPAEGPITVCEPACGSGGMILSFGSAMPPERRRRLRVIAIDKNRTPCDLTFINTTLWGIPTRVLHGDSLTMEFKAGWSNIHWLMPWLAFVPEGTKAVVPPHPPQGAPPEPAEQARIVAALEQLECDFDAQHPSNSA